MRLGKQVFSQVLVSALLVSAAFAGAKESPHDMLMKSFEQADLWNQGPVKLTIKVRMPANGHDVNLDYTVSWAGPDKWRAEWTAEGLDQVTILNGGKLSFFSTQNPPTPLVRALQFEQAVENLDGGNPAGPYTIPPYDFDKQKIETTKKKLNGVDAKCLEFGQPTESFCIDPANGRLLTESTVINSVELGSVQYSDYTTVGNTTYPQTITVMAAKTLMEEGKVTVSRNEKFADDLFTPQQKSTAIDFASCADVGKNFAAPHLTKPVPPKMTDAAKKANKYGVVWVLTTVGKDGSVTQATPFGGDPDLNPSAIAAVQQYKYTPYMRCGQAVGFQKLVTVPFLPPQKLPEEGVLPTK